MFYLLYNSAIYLIPLISSMVIVGIGIKYICSSTNKVSAVDHLSQNKTENKKEISLEAKLAKVNNDLNEIKQIMLQNIYGLSERKFLLQAQQKVDQLCNFQQSCESPDITSKHALGKRNT